VRFDNGGSIKSYFFELLVKSSVIVLFKEQFLEQGGLGDFLLYYLLS
jgi:hypothetical protein